MNKQEYLEGRKQRIHRRKTKLIIFAFVPFLGLPILIIFPTTIWLYSLGVGFMFGAIAWDIVGKIPLEVRKFITKAIEAYQD